MMQAAALKALLVKPFQFEPSSANCAGPVHSREERREAVCKFANSSI